MIIATFPHNRGTLYTMYSHDDKRNGPEKLSMVPGVVTGMGRREKQVLHSCFMYEIY